MSLKKEPRFPYKSEFGRFAADGRSFIITRPDTPRPWANILCSESYGAAVSQTGSGYSWLNDATRNRLTRWGNDLVRDDLGRYLYLRDDAKGNFWSVGWQPAQAPVDSYQCVHGVGCTIITSQANGVQSQWMTFVPHGEPLEIWRLRVKNLTNKPRTLSLWTYVEWDRQQVTETRRGYAKNYTETFFRDDNKLLMARMRLSTPPSVRHGGDRHAWDYTAWHGVNAPVRDICFEKEAFLGNYGGVKEPRALKEGKYGPARGDRPEEPIASLCVPLALKPGEERSILLTLGAAESESQALVKARQFQNFLQVDRAWHRTESFWDKQISSFQVQTPEPAFNLLTNVWLKYQVISARLAGKTGYARLGGAHDFQRQLADVLAVLAVDPERAREQIRLHASRQSTDGGFPVFSRPVSAEGLATQDIGHNLWFPYAVIQFIKETAQWHALTEQLFFARRPGDSRSQSATLYEHGARAIENVLADVGTHGLPSLSHQPGTGDVFAGHLLFGVLTDWAALTRRAVAKKILPARETRRAKHYAAAAKDLRAVLNKAAWDGAWYLRALGKNGEVAGGQENIEAKIFLNAQSWAVLGGAADKAKRRAVGKSLEKFLYAPEGPRLFHPPMTLNDKRAGSLFPAPLFAGGQTGTHVVSAAWALLAECQLGRADKAWDIYKQINPVLLSSRAPRQYRFEPFATAGRITPDGTGHDSWYNAAAAWLFRAASEGILGFQPDWEGLRLRPCLPPSWNQARALRVFRGGIYRVRYYRDRKLAPGAHRVLFNGKRLSGDLLPAIPGRTHDVVVAVGRAR